MWREGRRAMGKNRVRDSSCFPPLDHIVGHAHRVTLSLPVICQRFQYPPPRSGLLGAIPTSCKHSHGAGSCGPDVWCDLLSCPQYPGVLPGKQRFDQSLSLSTVWQVARATTYNSLHISHLWKIRNSFINILIAGLIDRGCYTEIVVRKCIIKIRPRLMGLSVTTKCNNSLRERK